MNRTHFLFAWISLLGWLLPSPILLAQTISGHVIDIQDGRPIDQVKLHSSDSTIIRYSKSDGSFEWPLPSKQATIHVFRPGYESQKVKLDPMQNAIQIGLNPESISLSEVRITSYASSKSNRETAGALAVITGEQLRQGNGVSLQSAFNSVPGVQMDQSNLSESRISIRGNGIRSPWGIRNIKIYLNEIPITEADGTSRLEAIDVHDIGSVEIIKGPASSLYGGGTGGVIRFQLQRAQYQEKSLEVSSLLGSYGLGRWSASFRHGGEKMNTYLSYGWQEHQGYREHSYDLRRFFAANFQIFPSEKQMLTLILNRSSQETQMPGALSLLQMKVNPRQAHPSQMEKKAGRNQHWTRFALGHRYQITKFIENNTSLFTYFYDLDHPLPFAYIRNYYQSIGARTQFQLRPFKEKNDFLIVWGAETNQAKTKGSQYQNVGGREGAVQSNTDYAFTQYTLFAHAESSIRKNTVLTAGLSYHGLRYDVTDYLQPSLTGVRDFKPQLSPRISISQRLHRSLTLHGSVSSGYSPPSSSEIKQIDGTVNPNIQAERGTNYELNLKGDLLKSRLNYDLALFNMNMRGELIGQSVQQGITVYHNTGKTRHQGIEASLSWNPIREEDQHWMQRIWVLASCTYSNFRFLDYEVLDSEGKVQARHNGNPIPGIAPWVAYTSLNFETRAGVYAHLQGFFKGQTPLNDGNTDFVEGYNLFHSKMGYRRLIVPSIGLDVYLGLENMANVTYSSMVSINAPSFGGAPPAYFHPSPGRQAYLGLQIKYHL